MRNDVRNRKTYCGMMNSVDVNVQVILDALEDKGVLDNTIIVVTSDNGGDNIRGGFNYPLRGKKNTLFEGGTRTPALVYAPKLIGTGVRSDFIHAVDWYKTLLSAAGHDVDGDSTMDDLDSVNQWEMIKTGSPGKRTTMVYNIDSTLDTHAVRSGKYKLIIPPEVDGTRGYPRPAVNWYPPPEYNLSVERGIVGEEIYLFDLDEDPTEHNNLASTEAAKVAELKALVEQEKTREVSAIMKEETAEGNPINFDNLYTFGWC